MSEHQTGPKAANKLNQSAPLEVHEKEKQAETGSPKGFKILVEGASMPKVTLEHKEAAGGSIKDIGAISQAKVYSQPLKDTFGEEENLHNQFVQENTIIPDQRKK